MKSGVSGTTSFPFDQHDIQVRLMDKDEHHDFVPGCKIMLLQLEPEKEEVTVEESDNEKDWTLLYTFSPKTEKHEKHEAKHHEEKKPIPHTPAEKAAAEKAAADKVAADKAEKAAAEKEKAEKEKAEKEAEKAKTPEEKEKEKHIPPIKPLTKAFITPTKPKLRSSGPIIALY